MRSPTSGEAQRDDPSFSWAAAITGCIAYDWDGTCQGELITNVVATTFALANPAGGLFGVMTGSAWFGIELWRGSRREQVP